MSSNESGRGDGNNHEDEKKREILNEAFRQGVFTGYQKGKELGFPQEELDTLVWEKLLIKAETNPHLIAQIMKNLDQETDVGRKKMGAVLYQEKMDEKKFGLASSIAEYVWGEESLERQVALQAANQKAEDIPAWHEGLPPAEDTVEDTETHYVLLPPDATLDELFDYLDQHDPVDDVFGFLRAVEDQYIEIWEELLALSAGSDRDRSDTTTVLDFFEEHGVSAQEVEYRFPIRFRSIQ